MSDVATASDTVHSSETVHSPGMPTALGVAHGVNADDEKNSADSVRESLDRELIAFDREHLWHPYAPTPNTYPHVLVHGAEGVYLSTTEGKLIDAMSSWWAAAHGHRHPAIVEAAKKQIDTMEHVMFGGLTHEPAVQLARKLVQLTGLQRVFYSDSGSVSVEVAMKMALQYQRGKGHPEKNRFLTWRSGYHGDTQGPMSVCDPEGGMHSMWEGTLTTQIFAPAPPVLGATEAEQDAYVAEFESYITDSVAAVIVEPHVQGAGGMRFHDTALVEKVVELCHKHGILFIADEIATGFKRTGPMFVTTGMGVDIMCVGKALTGGFLSFAATLTTSEVAEVIGTLMHGPTFMGNPLACAVSLASVTLMETAPYDIAHIESVLTEGLAPARDVPGVADVRVCGAIGVIEMNHDVDMIATTRAAMDEGIWIRPFGRLIYAMPPFICSDDELATICRGLVSAAAHA